MLKKLATLTVITVMSTTFCYGRTAAVDEPKPNTGENNSTSTAVNGETRPNEKLHTDMLNLVADAKAGKVAPAPRSQMQPKQSNNFSKGAKIAIGVGIAVAVIAIIVVVKADKAPTGSFRIF